MKPEIRTRRAFAALLLFSLLASSAWAQTFTVTNLDGSGPGSLRQAILDAERMAGLDIINFSVSGTIPLWSTLPTISQRDGLTIDGTGQSITISGNHSVRVVEVKSGGKLTLNQLTISNGSDVGMAGGILNGGTLTVTNSTISGNESLNEGAGIYNKGTLTLSNSAVSSNRTFRSGLFITQPNGGGIFNEGTLTLTNSTVSDNSAFNGGGIYNSHRLTISNSTISRNVANQYPTGGNSIGNGGGIYNLGTLTVINSAVSENIANSAAKGYDTGNGGGIYSLGTVTVANSAVSGNIANADVGLYTIGNGGGIYSQGNLTVTKSSVSSNSAIFLGGGIFNDLGTLTVTNSTLSGNAVSGNSEWERGRETGGGICNGGILTLTNSTVSGNFAAVAGGLDNKGVLYLTNTILANSPVGVDCFNQGNLIPAGVNLVEDGSCNVQGSLRGDPALGPLSDNGGPTETIALLFGSPAIDAITDSSCRPAATDQRGVSRPQGPYCDIGAFELENLNSVRPLPLKCKTVADLRSGGSTDTIRVTNQGTAELPYTVQFVNAQGVVQGLAVAKSLVANQSDVNTIGTLLQQAGIRTFNPANLLQIVTGPIKGMTESLLQSAYTPSITAAPVMMVYTCEPEAPR